jgi:hypothetical protein
MAKALKIGKLLVLGKFSSDPSGEPGALYYNTAQNKYKFYEDGAWREISIEEIASLQGQIGNLSQVDPQNYSDPGTQSVEEHLKAIDAALATAGGTDFSDDTFRISNEVDSSKKIAFDASSVDVSATRTITMPDADVDLGDIAENSADISDLVALSGVAANSENLGTFTGDTIADNQTVKAALQDLETEVELKADDADVIKKDGSVAMEDDLNLNNSKIVNLAVPTADQDAATKKYVDDEIQALENYTEDQVRYVAKNGDDTNVGSQHAPFLTISAALASITDAAPSKRYAIKVMPGSYSESALVLKANVFIVGQGNKETIRITGPVSMDESFSGNQDDRSGFHKVTLLSAANFDWSVVTSAAGKLYVSETVFGSTLRLYGHNNGIAQVQFNSCIMFGVATISGINALFTNNVFFSNVLLDQHPILATTFNSVGGYCNILTLQTTVDNFNRRCSAFLRSFWSEQLIVDGPSSFADVDLVSGSKQGAQKLNGGQVIALNPVVSHDLTTQMIVPRNTNAHNMGDWGKQWFWNFGYVHASTGTPLFLISYGSEFGPDSEGKNISILPDGAGLQTDVDGGSIFLKTSVTSGTGVRGNIVLDGREVDVSSTKIVNLQDPKDDQDAATKKYVDDEIDGIDFSGYVTFGQIGQPNGVASLDANGKLPVAQLPTSAMEYKGVYDAALSEPALTAGTGTNGDVYRVTVAGTQDLGDGEITFEVGDLVIYNGSVWQKAQTSEVVVGVSSVNGEVGEVELDSSDLEHTQANTANWTVGDESSVADHLDELAARTSDIEGKDFIEQGDDALLGEVKRGSISDFVVEEYIHSITLAANQEDQHITELSFPVAEFDAVEITYKAKQTAGGVRVGTFRMVYDGSSLGVSEDYAESASVDLDLNAEIESGNMIVTFTSGSNALSMRADVKKFKV